MTMSNFVDPFKVNKGEYLGKSKKEKGIRPKPNSISQWGRGDEIFYVCPKCKTDLRLLSYRQNFCFNCGIKFDWTKAQLKLTPGQREEYYKICGEYSRGEIDFKTREQKLKLFFEVLQ